MVATREPADPHRDLWWAHTGGGGGSFGIVTRYWFRTPGADGDDPSGLLPAPPAGVLSFSVSCAKGWFTAVHWHPEGTAHQDPAQQGLFDTLVRAARRRA
ncbi:hypothetical protein EJ357_41515 [Streptomyces cyaneochromogenes]|uniref:Glutamine amidotransferase domain-containing protein n=1 Tax=Streptomyces cyaneochromogenes TaxID=2496836 RepID=A0A3Q9EZF7_9ACTN|nr:hypothetical protein EJ357_41515 [Streptomyces cyaneochromogenes]